jgi:hypothetical protein
MAKSKGPKSKPKPAKKEPPRTAAKFNALGGMRHEPTRGVGVKRYDPTGAR